MLCSRINNHGVLEEFMGEADLAKLFQLATDDCDNQRHAEEIRQMREGKDNTVLPANLVVEGESPKHAAINIATYIRELRMPGKVKLALLGNQTARTLLIRDSNRLISLFVLENPRLTENEVFEFARNRDLHDSVVRTIAGNQSWMRNYAIKSAVVNNPKTPLDISLKWVKHLKEKDLRLLAKSRNIPHALAVQSRKLLERREQTN